jgi:hypothetical protein
VNSLINNESTDGTELKLRALALLDDRGLDYQTRKVLRYALRTADPLLPELVRDVEQGETLGGKLRQCQPSMGDKLTTGRLSLGDNLERRPASVGDNLEQRSASADDSLTTTQRSRNNSTEPERVGARADASGTVKDYLIEYELAEDQEGQTDSDSKMNRCHDVEFRGGSVDEVEGDRFEQDQYGPVEHCLDRCESFSLRENDLHHDRLDQDRLNEDRSDVTQNEDRLDVARIKDLLDVARNKDRSNAARNEDRSNVDRLDEDQLDEDEAIDAKVDELTALICRPGNELTPNPRRCSF